MTASFVRKRVGVLISGRGSNLASLIQAAQNPEFPAQIVSVVSNVPGVEGLGKAETAGIATQTIDHRDFKKRVDFDAAITAALQAADVEIVCNAGFMRLHSAAFVRHWRGHQLNIHPSLLPSFKGLHPQQQALDAGVRVSGCTVHFVSEDMDAGAILAQGVVPILGGDTAESLGARILQVEHALYPLALKLVATGAARLEGERVVYEAGSEAATVAAWPSMA